MVYCIGAVKEVGRISPAEEQHKRPYSAAPHWPWDLMCDGGKFRGKNGSAAFWVTGILGSGAAIYG